MRAFTVVAVCLMLSLCAQAADLKWEQLPSLPDREGFAGSFAGVSGAALLVAGGANFPGKKPWDGGTKAWYDSVSVLERPDGQWTPVGKLPRPLGYGVSVTYRDAVVCVGGSDAEKHYADVFRLEFRAGKLITKALPSLPFTIANACGALVGDTFYLAGGQERPNSSAALKTFWAIDLSAEVPQWQKLAPWPGAGRMLAVAADFDGAFWLMGGTDLVVGADGKVERRYLKDAFRYDPLRGWRQLTDLPHPVVAAPSPAAATQTGPLIVGGDDGTQAGVAHDLHTGFPKRVMRYDQPSAKWIEEASGSGTAGLPAPRATAPLVFWRDSWVLLSGEVRPGVRSPEVWRLTVESGK